MCARYTLYAEIHQLIHLYNIRNRIKFDASNNIAPTHQVPVIQQIHNERHLKNMRWGLVPFWIKNVKKAPVLINARAESIFQKPAFKRLIREQRCLFPVNGFYEWRQEGNSKQQYLIRKKSQEPFLLGGIFSENNLSCAILTKEANDLVKPIHERMPLIISNENIDQWLGKSSSEFAVQSLLNTSFYGEMEVVPINNLKNNFQLDILNG